MLYIVGTPLGNTEDISLRAVKTLINSDIILAEDTRSFSNLYKIIQDLYKLHPTKDQKIIPFYKDNEFEKLPEVLNWLSMGKEISLISESGMPLICDPGSPLVKYLTDKNIQLTVVPGPTAFVNAAVLAGFPTKQLLFLGFSPKRKNDVIQIFKNLSLNRSKNLDPTVVFYESPHRIQETLKLIREHLSNTKIVVVREMTKKFEEILSLEDALKKDLKGELTVVVRFNTLRE
jgi:16S rRNA (cytidine1402-2'-O)-methyltransferase